MKQTTAGNCGLISQFYYYYIVGQIQTEGASNYALYRYRYVDNLDPKGVERSSILTAAIASLEAPARVPAHPQTVSKGHDSRP